MNPPAISVIIPVRNNPEGIARVMECLEAQTLPASDFEIIIADDGSAPDQIPVVKESARCRVVSCPPRTSYAARNAGSLTARGAILAFCDSDCLPEPTWLEAGLAAMKDAEVAAGQVVFVPPAQPTIWSLLTIDMFLDQERDVHQSCAVTANLFVDHALFDRLQGFDESLSSGGDYDFVHRAVRSRARLVYAEHAKVCHPTMDRAREFLKKVRYTNYWAGARTARGTGAAAPRFSLKPALPIAGVMMARIAANRPWFGLHTGRLRASGISASPWDHLRATFLLHTMIAFTAGMARFAGWRQGRRLARRGAGPLYLRQHLPL